MTNPSVSEPLKRYKNHNRVLLVSAVSPEDEKFMTQQRLLGDAKEGLQKRDLVVLALLEGERAGVLRDNFEVSSDIFTVILVGKDGSEKERFLEPVQLEELFGVIDQMPMRRREMREQKG